MAKLSNTPTESETQATRIVALCRFIESQDQAPSLQAMAEHSGISASHLHRVFKAATGLTPKAYADAHKAQRLRSALANTPTVTDAMYEAGYNSNGRFYEDAPHVLGMTPTAYKQGGHDQLIRFAIGQCSLGAILVAQTDRGICAISMGDDAEVLVRELQDRFPRAQLQGGDAAFEQWVAQVVGLVESPKTGLTLPLDIRGTAFQQRVWQALRAIPCGQRVSYSELAQRIGSPKAVRAVASACAANTLAVVIPCHRVVRTDGSLSGYRWGVERKLALLNKESADG